MLPCCRKEVVVVSNTNQQYNKPVVYNQQVYQNQQQQLNQQVHAQHQIQNFTQVNQQQVNQIFIGSIYRQ